MIKIGCCGFRGKRQDYFKNFEVVEIQQTFYKLPMLTTAKKWRKEAPKNFEYAMKAWQLITHKASSPTYRKAGIKIDEEKKDKYGFFKPTKEVFEAWEECSKFAEELKAKFIVFQCPSAFKETRENIENMKQFFSSIEKKFVFAWEPRAEWKMATIVDLCKEYNLIHCVDPFKNESYYGEPKYYRLHGIGGYNYDYSREELKKLLEICKKAKDIYCFFNNTKMLKNALEFKEMIKATM
ncbi:hypothetical protein B6U81_04190 [Thermoplasmatales archaeon ex4484_30]|nr:MAG: DUF72 domain-containing protein [Thermoplasmata archaeon]OYT60940.1 MAG: hypothetical protein B6U81_04190 [Thermoplasmatales archaeon ex4484_30]